MPTTYANSINNNPIYAARAEADAAGNSISTTYATKSEVPEMKNLVAGSNVTITSTNNGIEIAATDTTYTFSTGLTESSGTVTVTNPVPSYSTATDSGKVLSVGSNGLEWDTPQSGTTYTAGNMISLTNNEIAVSTTAGVTDIQQVAALPANPVSTVLYLIPET